MCRELEDYTLAELIEAIMGIDGGKPALEMLLERCQIRADLAEAVMEWVYQPVVGPHEMEKWRASCSAQK